MVAPASRAGSGCVDDFSSSGLGFGFHSALVLIESELATSSIARDGHQSYAHPLRMARYACEVLLGVINAAKLLDLLGKPTLACSRYRSQRRDRCTARPASPRL